MRHAVAATEPRYTGERFFDLVRRGVIGEDDRVELLEGVIVAMSPQNPPHSSATTRTYRTLERAIGSRAVIRVQLPFLAGTHSVPEPDVVAVPGTEDDYDDRHPSEALLVVEVADSSLLQDRLTKSAIYASAGVPEYWIINLAAERIEIFREPDRESSRYRATATAQRDDHVAPVAFPDVEIAVADLLPRGATARGD